MDATASSAITSRMKLSATCLQNSDNKLSESYPKTRSYFPSCSRCPYGSIHLVKSSQYAVSSSYPVDHRHTNSNGVFSFQPEQNRETIEKAVFAGSTYTSTYDDGMMEAPPHVAEEKIGVLLLNLGGPETLNDVQPFLFNLFADPDIIRLPKLFQFLQRPLAKLISMLRTPKSKEGYASIGGGSPLRKITDEQRLCEVTDNCGDSDQGSNGNSLLCYHRGKVVYIRSSLIPQWWEPPLQRHWVVLMLKAHALKLALEAKKMNVSVYVGMRYWYPFTEEAVNEIRRDKITRLVILPLYPQFSISTTGSSLRVLQNMFREDAYLSSMPVAIIRSWYQREGYVKSMADLIEKELQDFSNPDEVMIFFSAHGVPLSYVEAGDPYKEQMEDCIFLIMGELKARGINNNHTLAYQSRVGPVQWLKPYTDEVLVELGGKGVKSLLAVPVSFVSEHIETLEEIDMEYKELALESGIENWGRVPALNCTASFITDLADAVIEALPSAAAMSTPTSTAQETDYDPFRYIIKLFFGSVLAFLLLLSPKMVLAFRNNLL